LVPAKEAAVPIRLFSKSSRRQPIVGLDIGTAMIKAVVLEKRHGRVLLKKAALAGTPAGVLTAGALTDGITVARSLKALFEEYQIKEKGLAVAVGGEKVLCQADRSASGGGDGVVDFIRELAAKQLSYPVSAACLGWQPVESMIEGAVLWTATPVEQVDWLREAVSLAGRKTVYVTPQACALANAYSFSMKPASRETVLLLNIGARCLTLALMRGWAIAYARDVTVTRERIDVDVPLAARLIKALDAHKDQIVERSRPHPVQQILITGGAAGSKELRQALQERFDVPVATFDPLDQMQYAPMSPAASVVEEHGPSLAVATGLALSAIQSL